MISINGKIRPIDLFPPHITYFTQKLDELLKLGSISIVKSGTYGQYINTQASANSEVDNYLRIISKFDPEVDFLLRYWICWIFWRSHKQFMAWN